MCDYLRICLGAACIGALNTLFNVR